MELKEFDEKFRELYTALIEIAFEYVNCNKDEVDGIYVFGAIDDGAFSYNVFYRINEKMAEIHQVNSVSDQQYDISDIRTFKLLDIGNDHLEAIAALFKEDNRPVPSDLKMIYSPKTGAFTNNIGYDSHFYEDGQKTIQQVYNEWFVEMGGKLG